MKKVAIIGAGITGLSAAYELKKAIENGADIEFKIFERDSRAGGVFLTEYVDGFLMDKGPDSFEIFKPAPYELAKELGIEDQVIDANEEKHVTYLYINGKLQEIPRGLLGLVPQNLFSLAFCPYLSWRAKFRAAMELFIPSITKGDEDLSIAEFYKRRFGHEVFENMAEPLFGSIYACIPETISLKACWKRGMELEQKEGGLLRGILKNKWQARKQSGKNVRKASMFKTFKNGMSTLIEELVRQLPHGTIEFNREVANIIESSSRKYMVIFADGSTYEADACIIATSPSYATARIIEKLDRAISDMLLKIPFASSATINLAYKKKDFSHPLDGFGFLVPRKEKTNIKASTWSSTKFEGRAPEDGVLIRCFVGNASDETVVYKTDDEIIDLVLKDLHKIMGISAEPLHVRLTRWYNAMPQFTIGHLDRLKLIEEREAWHPGLYLAGNAYRGLGVGDCIVDGRQAARKAINYLSKK